MTEPPPPFDYDAALQACALGDRMALHRLYQQECPRILGVVQRIVRDLPRAEDIVHDVFVRIWQKAGSFDASRGEGRGWIYSIARHLALNAVRDGRHEVAVDEEATEALDLAASLQAWRDSEDSFAWHDHAGRLRPCMERLEPVRRNCLLHAYVDGLSHSEIAQATGAPLGTVKAWIKRSLAALRECLG